jgi:hypothetical protein
VDVVVYDDADKRYVPLLVAAVLALLAGLVIGGLSYELGRRQPGPQLGAAGPVGGVSEPQAAARADDACVPAVERAQAALDIATRLSGALEEQTSVMDELLADRVTQSQALDRSLPVLTTAAKDRQEFADALTAYEQARAACQQ